MRCPECNSEIPEESKFCTNCGALNPNYARKDENAEMVDEYDHEKTIDISNQGSKKEKEEEETFIEEKEEISKIFETSGVCPNCYTPLEKGSTRCMECGYTLTAKYCSSCGKPVSGGEKYCSECAKKFESVTTKATVEKKEQPVPSPPSTHEINSNDATRGHQKKKSFPVILLLLILIVLLLIIGGTAWWGYNNFIREKSDQLEKSTRHEGTLVQKVHEKSQLLEDARHYESIGEEDKAYSKWSEYLKKFSPNREASLGLAKIEMNRGDLNKALKRLQEYLVENKSDAEAFGLAGIISERLGQRENALRYLLTASTQAPDNSEYKYELGKLYAELGFPDKSVFNLREAIRINPENEAALWYLIKELRETNQNDVAKKLARDYMERFPLGNHSEQVKSLLSTLVKQGEENVSEQKQKQNIGSTIHETSQPSTEHVSPKKEYKETPPTPPSPYVTIIIDGTALNLPDKLAEVTVSFAGIQRKFYSGTHIKIFNVEKGSFTYNVVVTYYNVQSNEKEFTYTGSGIINIKYPNQKIYVKLVNRKVFLE